MGIIQSGLKEDCNRQPRLLRLRVETINILMRVKDRCMHSF